MALQLTPDERADVILIKVIDAFWKGIDYRTWWNGEDALTEPDADGFRYPLIHLPGFQAQLRANLNADGLQARSHVDRWGLVSDYLRGEYVHKSEQNLEGKLRVVPDALNVMVERYFGSFKRLFGYQLAMWYSPKKINMVVGGRGSGKTQGLAIIAGIHCATHPGEDWLHIALTLDQAIELYDKLKDVATKRAYLSSGALCPKTFADTFFWKGGNPMVSHPYPKIIFEPWDNDDAGVDEKGVPLGGNAITVRALGDEASSERRRGKTIGGFSGDELFRELKEWGTITKVADAIRGPNEYLLAKLSPERKQEYVELTRRLRVAEERGNTKLAEELSLRRNTFGIEKTGRQLIVGNSGSQEWVYEFEDEYEDDPVKARAWFTRISMYDNPYLTAADRQGYEERWADNPEERDVELIGNRPVGLGGEIDPELLRSAIRSYSDVVIAHSHRSHGVQHMSRPPKPDHYYMIVGDLGQDRAPKRNSPCIMVSEFNPYAGGMDLVYFWWGWERKKTYSWFLRVFKECMDTYPVLDSSYWVYDSGGTQAGTFEVFRSYMGQEAGTDDIFGYPMRMLNVQKETAKKLIIQALNNKWIRWPEVKALIAQPSNWNLEMDRDGQPQDVTMVLFMSVMRGWQILNDPDTIRSVDTGLTPNPYDDFTSTDYPQSKPLIKVGAY